MARADTDRLMEMIRERDCVAALVETLERRIVECTAQSFDLPSAIAEAEDRGDLLIAARLRGRRPASSMNTPTW